MNCRERLQRTLTCSGPDRLPVFGHPSTAGLYIQGEKLRTLLRDFPFDNEVDYRRVPAPPAAALRDGEYHEFRTDGFGTEWEYRIFGLHGHPHRYAFADWREAARFDFSRLALPALPTPSDPERIRCCGWQTLFETLHAVRPMEEALIGIALRDSDMLEFLARLTEFRCAEIRAYADQGADIVYLADDWGSQTGPLISPDDWRELFREPYRRMIECAHQSGLKVLFHSCGELTPIWSELFALGIDLYWPQVKLLAHRPALMEEGRDRGVTLLVRPDPQTLMPLGTPEEIDRTVAEYAGYGHRHGGGVIFHVELENDVPWINMQALLNALERHCPAPSGQSVR